jgi:aspartyl-tRNA(Asn)/glutamyl-tRNA(Gln) amidotransferase subunit A
MTDLTALTLAQARDGLAAKSFTAVAQSCLCAGNGRTIARDMRGAGRRCDGTRRGRAAAGIPLGIKDLFATERRAHHGLLENSRNFVPQYESTVTSQLWRDGAVMLGKLNNDEFAMGSSNETSRFGTGRLAVAAQGRCDNAAGAGRLVRRLRRCGGGQICAWARPAPIPAARSVSLRPLPASSASSRPMGAARAGALSPSPRRSIRPGPFARTVRDTRHPAALDGGTRSEGYDLGRCAGAGLREGDRSLVKGMKIGIPKEYRVEGMSPEIEALWTRAASG